MLILVDVYDGSVSSLDLNLIWIYSHLVGESTTLYAQFKATTIWILFSPLQGSSGLWLVPVILVIKLGFSMKHHTSCLHYGIGMQRLPVLIKMTSIIYDLLSVYFLRGSMIVNFLSCYRHWVWRSRYTYSPNVIVGRVAGRAGFWFQDTFSQQYVLVVKRLFLNETQKNVFSSM